MKCSYHFSENWIPAVVRAGKWKLAAVLQVILQKDKYIIYPFAIGLKNVIFFQTVEVLHFSILCFPIPHSNTVCYSDRPLSGQILHKPYYHSMQIFLPFYWPRAHDCLQIIACSCAIASNCARLQMIFCSCVSETTFFFFLRSLLLCNWQIANWKTNSVIK